MTWPSQAPNRNPGERSSACLILFNYPPGLPWRVFPVTIALSDRRGVLPISDFVPLDLLALCCTRSRRDSHGGRRSWWLSASSHRSSPAQTSQTSPLVLLLMVTVWRSLREDNIGSQGLHWHGSPLSSAFDRGHRRLVARRWAAPVANRRLVYSHAGRTLPRVHGAGLSLAGADSALDPAGSAAPAPGYRCSC